MKSAKSSNSKPAGQQQQQQQLNSNGQQQGNASPTSPICRCRVMYLGSSVPHITKDGLQGIQEPLRELYPDKVSLDLGNAGIDSWLSVWSNGILIENVDETGREVKRFFKIEALHYCAAVKFVPQNGGPEVQQAPISSNQANSLAGLPKFLPLDSPNARLQQSSAHPPIFASILRRTTGVKVLECHAFICKREAAANALVRCCFHAYADTMYAKQIGTEIDTIGSPNGRADKVQPQTNGSGAKQNGAPAAMARRSKSIAALNDADNEMSGEFSDSSNRQQQQHYSNSVSRRKSLSNGNYSQNGDISDSNLSQQQQRIYGNPANNLQKHHQSNYSKSMHQLNQPDFAERRLNGCDLVDGSLHSNQSNSHYNLSSKQTGEPAVPEPFFNPYSSRVPSYPPQSIIDQQQTSTGTLRSVKSVAANSIASTLLRSKKHAKAMSMAQLNHSSAKLNQLQNDQITSFHQPHNFHQQQMAATMGPGFMTLPPVPPMFLPNISRLPQMNGSQTMKLPSRHTQAAMLGGGLGAPLPQINFEAMTPKEMKKLLKKSAKHGIDPSRFTDNGLPLFPLRPMPMPLQMPLPLPPPLTAQQVAMMGPPASIKSGTLGSQSLYSMDLSQGADVSDYGSQAIAYGAAGLGPPPPPPPPLPSSDGCQGSPMQPIKSILVKPNPEFLRSKAGKKWLKQQKEFKKLLPPHLDGLPIVFGPPPLDALEPADGPADQAGLQPPPQFLHPQPPPQQPPPNSMGLPVMDSNGYYNLHPFYGPSGRASAASTLLRYSPHSQMMHQQQQLQVVENGLNSELQQQQQQQIDYMQSQHQAQALYSDPNMLINQQLHPKAMSMLGQANGFEPMLSSSQLGTFDRQFPFASERPGQRQRHGQARNHMVEQSVISLGDENDCDDDEPDLQREDEDYEGQNGGYYDRVGSTSSRSTSQQQQQQHPRRHHSSRARDEAEQQVSDYSETEQHQHQQHLAGPQQGNEEQANYAAGIYRRKHINERAFSYSIRQEHKSNGGGNTSNSEADYGTDHGADYSDLQQSYRPHRRPDDRNNHRHPFQSHQKQQQQQQQQQQQTYDNPQMMQAGVYQSRAQMHLRHQQQQPPPPPPPVDMDLSARLGQQLNMKSFANSAVKSHM